MDKIKILFIIVLFSLFSFRGWQTTGCKKFLSFYFNPLSIKVSVETNVNTDLGVDRNISRLFHNKVTVGIFELSKSFASTFQPRFLGEFLGPVGLILVVTAFLEVFKKRKYLAKFHFILILIASFIAIFTLSSKASFFLLVFFFILFLFILFFFFFFFFWGGCFFFFFIFLFNFKKLVMMNTVNF